MVHKIMAEVSEEQLQKDLEKYRQRAIELGATDAKIITTDKILIDERVRAKCYFPLCDRYGSNANCPPHGPGLELTRKAVSNFRYAIFIYLEIPTEKITGPEAREKRWRVPYQLKNFEIVGKIEPEAFHDGHYFAMGFANGSCKSAFCPDKECTALIPGQACVAPLKARASMEGVGMDAYGMAARAGWEIYPIAMSTSVSDVPHGVALGLVLIY